MHQRLSKPQNADELLAALEAAMDDLGRSGRRIASFFVANPDRTALLSSAEVAERCEVNASSVVRLAQNVGFSGFRELQAVLQQRLSGSTRGAGNGEVVRRAPSEPLHLHLLADSGRSFVEAAEAAVKKACLRNPSLTIATDVQVSYLVDPISFADRIKAAGSASHGVILVAREHPAINEAVRDVTGSGVPVICLTTDLPASGRTAYVGSDQYASGATAGWLCGRMLPRGEAGRVLFISSVPFRCHQDREQGFRHVLRSEFPWLGIDERLSSDESADTVRDAVCRYVQKNGPPAAIYNVAGANSGVGRALEAEQVAETVVFIGHELNPSSRSLLERGIMDVAIGHDFVGEIISASECVEMALRGIHPVNRITQSQVFTRFNCAIF